MRTRYASGLTPLIVAAVFVAAGTAQADGPGAYRPQPSAKTANPEQGAIEAYNQGFAAIQRAEHPGTSQSAAQKAYKQALAKFKQAAQLDPSMHEAFTYVGYASRKLGRYEDALTAYDKALRLNPDYPHAIEYQAEAFLGLNRVEEARFNYLRLYGFAPGQADKLLEAMRKWVAANEGKQVSGVDIQSFAAWVSAQKPSGTSASSGSW